MFRFFQTGAAALVLVAMASAAPAQASSVSTPKRSLHRWLDNFWTVVARPAAPLVCSRQPAGHRNLKDPRLGRLESLTQPDGSYIDPNGGRGSVREPPSDPGR
jgi:hypothetical protein